jgi:hypothetical protein
MGLIKDISSPTATDDTAELNYFFDILDHFIEKISSDVSLDKNLTLIARSPEANIAKACIQYREKLSLANIELKVIFAQITPTEQLCEWLEPENSPCGLNPEKNIRWGNRQNLVDAHEQLTLTNQCSWSGESMRREVSSRFGFYIFDQECKQAAIRGERAFNALWQICDKIPQVHIKRAKQTSEQSFLGAHSKSGSFTPSEVNFLASEFTRH